MPVIRRAEPLDRDALITGFSALQAFERTIESNRTEPKAIAAAYVDELLLADSAETGAIFVAVHGGAIVGFVALRFREQSEGILEEFRDHAYVTDLFVHEAHRGRGLGRRLMQTAEESARRSGASRIRVGVLAVNDRAHDLYRALGYRDYEIVLEKSVEPG